MITFEQARQIALSAIGPTWTTDDCGPYTVAAYGYEDAEAWCLVDGPARLVLDGDFGCESVGRGSTFVDKCTGAVFFLTYLEDPERFDALNRVGQDRPTDDPDSAAGS
jgi:hypothetical protein